MPEYRLYRRLTDEDYTPVLRPVLGPAPGIPAQCEVDVHEVVEVHLVDSLGSHAIFRLRVLPDDTARGALLVELWSGTSFASLFPKEPECWRLQYPWGELRLQDGLAFVVLHEAGPHIL